MSHLIDNCVPDGTAAIQLSTGCNENTVEGAATRGIDRIRLLEKPESKSAPSRADNSTMDCIERKV